LQRAAERFAQAKAAVVGIVLNEVTKQGGYGSAGYGHGYAPYEADSSMVEVPAQANGTSGAKPAGSGRRSHRPR
jgi:Mrp family chromosome partitioning ATPase